MSKGMDLSTAFQFNHHDNFLKSKQNWSTAYVKSLTGLEKTLLLRLIRNLH